MKRRSLISRHVFVVIANLIIAALVAFVPSSGNCQVGVQSEGLSGNGLSIDILALSNRSTLSFSDWSGVSSSVQPALSLRWTNNDLAVNYRFTPRWEHEASFTPAQSFVVSTTDFYSKDSAKPVALQWRFAECNRLSLSLGRGELRPVVAGRWQRVNLEATGTKDDKVVTATQDWNTSLWAGGATFVSAYPGLSVELTGLYGDRWRNIGVAARWAIAKGWWVIGGYEWEEIRLDGLTNRNSMPFVGISVGR